MRYFASLDASNTCTGIQLSERDVVGSNIVEVTIAVTINQIPQDDFLWRKYENGAWSAEKFPPAPPAPLVDEITPLKSQMSEVLLTLVTNNLM